MKKFVAVMFLVQIIIMVIIITALLSGCNYDEIINDFSDKDIDNKSEDIPEIVFWHFNMDEGPKLSEEFMHGNKDIEVKTELIGMENQSYQAKILTLINTNGNVPDVYAAEASFLKRFVDQTGGYDDLLQEPYNVSQYLNNMYNYVVENGKDKDGVLRVLSYQANPIGIGYKKSIAKEYLGTDDPNEIGKRFANRDSIIELGRELKVKSEGKIKLFPGESELFQIYISARKEAWIKDNRFFIDPLMIEYLDLVKIIRKEGLDSGLESWKEEWMTSITDDIHFAYAIPAWGLSYIIGVNQDEGTIQEGGWAICKPPYPSAWGGTWFGIYSGSKKKEAAWEFLKFLTIDTDVLKERGRKSVSFLNNKNAVKDLLIDQKMFSNILNDNINRVFEPLAENVNGKTLTVYDELINEEFKNYTRLYLEEKLTQVEMIKVFKDKIKEQLAGKGIAFEESEE